MDEPVKKKEDSFLSKFRKLILARKNSDEDEKKMVIDRNIAFRESHLSEAERGIERLKKTAREGGNLFEVMMDVVEHCTVGQVTEALFETGGQFRRNM